MKKKIISAMIMTLVLAAGISASAYYDKISYSDGTVTVTPYNGVVIGIASEGGRITKIKTYDLYYYHYNYNYNIDIKKDFFNGEHVKFMLWDSLEGMEPLAESIEETITDSNDAPVSVTLKSSDFDYDNPAYEGGYLNAGALYFNGSQEPYPIASDAKLLINGVEYSDVDDGISKYLAGNDISDVILTDYADDESKKPNGVYDVIEFDCYVTMVVDYMEVSYYRDEWSYDLYAMVSENANTNLFMDSDFGRTSCKFTKNGSEISPEEVSHGDVVSVKYNVNKNIRESKFFDITVSSEVLKGKYSSYNEEENTYEIDGKAYKAMDMAGKLDADKSYIFYIDAFGRIAYAEEDCEPKQLAVLDEVSDNKASLILPDSSKAEYVIENADENAQKAIDIVYDENGNKNMVYDRVVEYSLNSDNEISFNGVCGYAYNKSNYYQSIKRIGEIPVSEETLMINCADLNDIYEIKLSDLVKGSEYTIFAYDKDAENNYYRFVIITSAPGKFSKDTQLAVFKNSVLTQNGDEPATAYVLLVNGEEQQIDVTDNVTGDTELSVGDAIIYETNRYGKITNVKKIASKTDFGDYPSIWEAAVINTQNIVDLDADTLNKLSDDKVEFTFGAVLDKDNISITLASIEDNVSSKTGREYTYDVDVNIYVYDSSDTEKVQVGGNYSIYRTSIPPKAYVEYSNKYFNWRYSDGDTTERIEPQFALIRTVAKFVEDVYIISFDY